MECPKCGNTKEDDLETRISGIHSCRKCGHCWKENVCSNCGKPMFMQETECRFCGYPVDAKEQEVWHLCKGKFRNPFNKRFLRRTKRMVKVYAREYGVPVDELELAFAESLIPKHAFVGLETYADLCREIERLAINMKENEME